MPTEMRRRGPLAGKRTRWVHMSVFTPMSNRRNIDIVVTLGSDKKVVNLPNVLCSLHGGGGFQGKNPLWNEAWGPRGCPVARAGPSSPRSSRRPSIPLREERDRLWASASVWTRGSAGKGSKQRNLAARGGEIWRILVRPCKTLNFQLRKEANKCERFSNAFFLVQRVKYSMGALPAIPALWQ